MRKQRRAGGLDDRDIAILRELQSNARISNAELARRVHLSATPCLERVKRLERDGYIDRYATLLNADKLDTGLLVFLEVVLDRRAANAQEVFARAVAKIPEILECHMVSGGFDYILKLRALDMTEYRRMLGGELTTLPGVSQVRSYVVLERVKSTTLIPL